MGIDRGSFVRYTFLLAAVIALILAVSNANAQTSPTAPAQEKVAAVVNSPARNTASPNVPVFTDYRGIKIGMPAKEVRAKLDRLQKGTNQDFLTFSEQESAQIYYDREGKVTAISIDYFGDISNAPSSQAVLGIPLEPRENGSIYQLNRYPDAGYWVSYNRTAGDKPIVTITMQKM